MPTPDLNRAAELMEKFNEVLEIARSSDWTSKNQASFEASVDYMENECVARHMVNLLSIKEKELIEANIGDDAIRWKGVGEAMLKFISLDLIEEAEGATNTGGAA